MASLRDPLALGRLSRVLGQRLRGRSAAGAFASADYWQARYAAGGTSGAGSYGRLADYKAGVINDLVERLGIGSVIEFGSGDGNQASLLRIADYTGVDVSDLAVTQCAARFADRPGWRFLTLEAFDAAPRQADLSMSLDVIYHLVEDQVYEAYMRRLVAAAGRYLLVYASDHDQAGRAVHVRHRGYSAWLAANAPHLELAETFAQPYPAAPGQEDANSTFAFFRLFRVTDGAAGGVR